MSSLFKDVTRIISEAAEAEDFECSEIYEDELEEEIMDDYEEIEELDDDIEYHEEMVPVISQESAGRFLVECENVIKIMESKRCDVKEAMEKICEANNIPFENTYLVLEAQDVVEDIVHEKAAGKSKSKKVLRLKNTSNFLQSVKNKGIKVVKKKSKKKKKK